MKKLSIVLALALMLIPAIVVAQPPAGCSWIGDPILRFGWFGNYPEGNDTIQLYAGQTYVEEGMLVMNAFATYTPLQCHGTQTFCLDYTDTKSWTITADAPMEFGTWEYWADLPPSYGDYPVIRITCPCNAIVGEYNMVVVGFFYVNDLGDCAPECGDCNDPTIRPANGARLWNKDTLWVEVVESPPSAIEARQDTVTLVDEGQTQAYIPFTVASPNPCAPSATAGYRITSKGHVGAAIDQSGTVVVAGGHTVDVYGIINAGLAVSCAWDTLMIIVWNTADDPKVYDTCVQRIHVVEPEPVPLFTVPVITILVLALILAAAVFMRRRAVSRA